MRDDDEWYIIPLGIAGISARNCSSGHCRNSSQGLGKVAALPYTTDGGVPTVDADVKRMQLMYSRLHAVAMLW